MPLRRSVGALLLIFTIVTAVLAPRSGRADGPLELIFTVSDTIAEPADSGFLSIYIDNYFDTIAGFQVVLVSERPDLVRFNFENGGFDTTGTLVSGFEYVEAIDRAEDQTELWFRCIANMPGGVNYRGFPPQQGGLVARIPYVTFPLSDTAISQLCPITVTTPFDFSNPSGYSIGTAIDTSYDTTWYVCQQYQGDSCLAWLSYTDSIPNFDSVSVDTLTTGYLDTTRVVTEEGSIFVKPGQCDMNGDGSINVIDLTCLVSYLFGVPSNGCTLGTCDLNESGTVEITDLTKLVAQLFGT